MTSEHFPPLYISGAAQISAVPPALDPLNASALPAGAEYVRSADPDFSTFLRPAEMRRMGLILRRAAHVSAQALQEAGIRTPDAVVTGTGLGCVESTERFLDTLCRDGESLLSPTHFMQSTHNTIGSLIAIRTGCHGYNATFSHRGISFDSALHNARLLLQSGKAGNALVGGHDEVTPTYYTLLRRSGYVGNAGQCPCCEASAAFVLTGESTGAELCRLAGTLLLHHPDAATVGEAIERLCRGARRQPAEIDALMTYEDGMAEKEEFIAALHERCLPHATRLRYKHIFGECYSSSALGFYAAVRAIASHRLPKALIHPGALAEADRPFRSLLFLNHSPHNDFSLSLLLVPDA